MAYRWKILRGAVEQEILFPSEKDYEEYLERYFVAKDLPFEIVDEQENEDGTYTVIMRKPYNNNAFLQREPELPDEVLKQAFMEQAEELERGCGNWQELPDTDADQKLRERIMAEARKREGKKHD